ncbi:hypothetical protein Pint_32293 [Pistacia integerrima]|uniref:Uncharacterized protein n=1 Tax=Pistacia integerrima TaxID=434235 RepID=A0ACC0XLQ1_9ROSI|nr:hypothetical protein Pint_32293 [Pistacia integerrima]
MVVESNIVLPQSWRTLRVFTSHRKNCYSIDVEKGAKILVRPSFYHGNYDKKSSPLIFDLHFDGNYWAIEVRSLSMNMYKEVGKNYGLILRRRVSFGTKEIVRYPVDEYDKIWNPANNKAGSTEATSDAPITVNLEDNPPAAVI